MKTLFLDVETTGTEPTDRLCQVALKYTGDEVTLWPTQQVAYFKPPVPVSIDAMAITHITNEMLEEHSIFTETRMCKDITEILAEPSTVFVAHNAQFDIEMLKREGLVVDPLRQICTMKIAHDFDKNCELGKHNLQYLRYFYGLKFDFPINPHDALSDIIVLEGLFNFYRAHYTIEEMMAISAKPILLKKMMFGKHKDKFFKDVIKYDFEYFSWMRRSMDMDENLRYTVDYWINNRNK